MRDFDERSAYPHPEDFEVMRPEYTELEDGYFQASITVSPFRVTGKSATKPGAVCTEITYGGDFWRFSTDLAANKSVIELEIAPAHPVAHELSTLPFFVLQ